MAGGAKGWLVPLAAGVVVLALTTAVPRYADAQAVSEEVTGDVVRLEIKGLEHLEEAPPGWWGQFQQWLRAGRPTVIRPAPGTKFAVESSAYASSPYQTDSTPCITAAGTRVRPGVVASNFLPLGALLEIDDDIDSKGKLYIVEDRMNARYARHIDVWFHHTSDALQFGRKQLTIEIVGYGTPGQELVQSKEPVKDKTPSLKKRLGWRFLSVARSWSALLLTKINLSVVNRYDVDCFAGAKP